MYLVCIRHGQSVGNVTAEFSTQNHDQLTQLGLEQAQFLAKCLGEHHIDCAYGSPLTRAIQTAEPWAALTGKKVELWPELAESFWQDDTSVDQRTTYPLVPHIWPSQVNHRHFTFRDGNAVMPYQDEAYADGAARRRMVRALLKERHEGSKDIVVLFSHGWFLSQLMEDLMGLVPSNRCDISNTGISALVETKGQWRVRYINRLPHPGSALL